MLMDTLTKFKWSRIVINYMNCHNKIFLCQLSFSFLSNTVFEIKILNISYSIKTLENFYMTKWMPTYAFDIIKSYCNVFWVNFILISIQNTKATDSSYKKKKKKKKSHVLALHWYIQSKWFIQPIPIFFWLIKTLHFDSKLINKHWMFTLENLLFIYIIPILMVVEHYIIWS